MGIDPLDDRLEAARQSIQHGAWREALDLLDDEEARTSPEGLESRAEAFYGAGDFEACVGSWEDLHALLIDRGDHPGAARAAAMVAMYLMMDTGLMAPVRGWLRCAERDLAGLDDHPVRAIVAFVRAYERFMCGAMDEARRHAEISVELGERFGIPPAVVIGRTCIARLTIFDGDVELGLELLDEVGALLMSGAVDPLTTGMMYCEIICAAQGLLMPDLAAQWTDVMERWRHGAAFGGLHGRCRVHRAEVLRISGTCEMAEAEALAACDALRPWMRREFGWPLVELGNVRLRAGDLDGAEDAYRQASANAWTPQPGLALVQLARGDADLAASMIAAAIEHPMDIPSKERPPFGPLRLAPLYDAQAQIAHVRGDRSALEQSAAALDDVADRYPSPVLRASARLARARLSLLDEDPRSSIENASRAVTEFNGIGAPFEAALARVLLADALEAAGRSDHAAFERRTACDALESFGAQWWADRLQPGNDGRSSNTEAAPAPTEAVFRRVADMREVGFGGTSVVVRDLKGLRYVERLLGEPGREFHAADLVRLETGGDVAAPLDRGLPMLDDDAKEAYRRRLVEVEDDIAAALADNDIGRAELAERDREYLVAELARAVGLGGRDRTAADPAERARGSVTRSIRYALDRLAESSPEVASHLQQHVHTGTFCRYEPEPIRPLRWTLGNRGRIGQAEP